MYRVSMASSNSFRSGEQSLEMCSKSAEPKSSVISIVREDAEYLGLFSFVGSRKSSSRGMTE